MVDTVREMLRLEADSGAPRVPVPFLRGEVARHPVTRVKLHARLGGVHLHRYARFRGMAAAHVAILALLFLVEDVGMVVAIPEMELLEIIVDT